MSGRAVGFRVGWLALAAHLLARPASASPDALVVDCPGLSAELRASLEARTRADLSMKRVEGWQLRVVCDGARAAVEFTPAGGVVSRREGALAGEPEDWVDRVLALVHEASSVPDEPPPASPPASDATFSVDTARPEPARTSDEPAPPVAPPPPPATRVDSGPFRPVVETPFALALEPEASLGVEVWPAEPLVLLGPAASVGLRLERRFRLVPTVSAAWSTGSSSAIAVRSLDGGLDAVLGVKWWVALGARVAWLRFDPPSALWPVSRTVVDPALVGRAGLSIALGPGRVSACVGARTYAERRDVRLDGTVALRVPSVALLAAVGYAAELL
jgi:hypothetical protein